MAYYWSSKDPDEIADYEIKWDKRLEADSITASSWIVPTGIAIDDESFTATSTKIWLAGGAPGSYTIVNRVVTQGGRTYEETVTLRVLPVSEQIITLDEFKEHARILHDDEDGEIAAKVEAANAYVAGLLEIDDADSPPYEPPADVKQAALMIAAHWFENRENAFPGSINDVPLDAQQILLNHRGWAF